MVSRPTQADSIVRVPAKDNLTETYHRIISKASIKIIKDRLNKQQLTLEG